MKKQTIAIYIVLFLFIFTSITYLFFSTNTIQKDINTNIEKILVSQAGSFAKNIEKEIHSYIKKDPYSELKKDEALRHRMEHAIATIVNEYFQYVYVLYRDANNNFRYLLDGSADKGSFNQRLNVEKEYWNKVYTTKKPVIINQNNLENIWITYLQPVIFDNEVKAVVAIDFSTQLPASVYNAIEPLKKVFIYIFVSISLLVAILAFQTFLGIKSKKASITDALTQTYNRTFLRELLERINIADYQIMMIDIDHFKQINDNYGHKAGDLILAKTAQLINNMIRKEDYLIRFGGEEFLLFIKRGKHKRPLAYKIAQRIRRRIEKTSFDYEGKVITITASIGLTCEPTHFKTVSDAIKNADEMLYSAKRAGRNTVISKAIQEQNNPVEKKSIDDIKEALEDGRLTCYFQAIYNTQRVAIVKYEALARIIEKDGTVIAPFQFLGTIINTNIYNDFTKQILEITFAKIKEKKITISINLNFSDIIDNKTYATILEELKNHKELAKWLIIELLEYEHLTQNELVSERLEEIRSYGIKIALDDFGSGYANYIVFQTLPIDILKLDGSLIKDIDASDVTYKITRSIVTLAKELNIVTVAEFVHSKSVLDKVTELEIDEAQGFYLAKPSPDI
jgi:diguanylate cyclase (GGDEF)-like protein